MSKLILISVIIAIIAIPARAARHKSARQGLKRAIVLTLLFDAFYAFALVFLWGRC
jgi:hypothetical protein